MERFPVETGPLLEQTMLSGGIDFYKPTMSQVAYEHEPDAEVTFTFKNRGEQRIADYVDLEGLQARFDALKTRGWTDFELGYLASLNNTNGDRIFSDAYLDYLRNSEMPAVQVGLDAETDDIAIETTGPWAMVTFWETVVMGEVNEAHFEGYIKAHDLSPLEVYDEGDRRLSEKIGILQAHPEIKFSDFGNRRHFSLRWQSHVLERLMSECPQNLIGTSNVGLADKFGLKPIGTFAHEMPMVYAALADARGDNIRASHNRFLNDWFDKYGEDLSVVLTDTFGTDFFFVDFTQKQAENWRSVRQDSGDPVTFCEKLVSFYEDKGIDPLTKTIVFSDGLDIDQIVMLQEKFGRRINVLFGWGTTLTNDMGIRPLNIVMKATYAKDTALGVGESTVKLSDNAGKHTGSEDKIKLYRDEYFNPALVKAA